jgi:putative ABC transport system permease protein
VPLIVRAPVPLFGLERAAVDWRVALFGIVMTLVAGLVCALLPALHWAGRQPADALRTATRVTGERRLTRTRSVLVTGQIAIAAILLATTGLLLKSLLALVRVDPGFQAAHVQSLEYRLPANKYTDLRQQAAFHQTVVERAAAIPGVRRAAVVRALPFSGNGDMIGIRTDGMTATDEPRPVWSNTVSDEYFGALGIPLLQGRTFDARDDAAAPLVTVVSRTFADRMWPGRDPIGRDFEVAGLGIRPRVIGVVGDVRQYNLIDDLLPAVYVRVAQNPGIFMTLVVETVGDPDAVTGDMRRAVWAVDPDQPVWKERSLASLVDATLDAGRFQSRTLATFAAAAILLVIAGLYGVVSQSVAQRSREIGVRMMLGADRRAVLRQVLLNGMKLAGIGLALGLGAAMLVAKLTRQILYRTSPVDALPYLLTTAVLGAIAIAACYLPARRAASVDPSVVLRD